MTGMVELHSCAKSRLDRLLVWNGQVALVNEKQVCYTLVQWKAADILCSSIVTESGLRIRGCFLKRCWDIVLVTKSPVSSQKSDPRSQCSYWADRIWAWIALLPAFTCCLRRICSLRNRPARSICCVPALTFEALRVLDVPRGEFTQTLAFTLR